LRDEDALARGEAADALGRLGTEAVSATEALAGALRDEEPAVRLRAARALWRIGGTTSELAPPALLALVSRAEVTRPGVRLDAAVEIRKIGGETEAKAISSLAPLTAHEAPAFRREAIECLERFGPRARVAVPALERALGDDDRVVRCLAALALSEIEGWRKGRARTLLTGMVDDPALSTEMRKRVRWVVDSDLVNGSEYSQPVHVLRDVVAELRRAEAQVKPGPAQPSVAEATEPD
jgi:HEAT repeat protein